MSATLRLQAMGLTLPPPARVTPNYQPWRRGGNMLFLSGVGPRRIDGITTTGKIGQALTIQEGYDAAKLCGLNLLAAVQDALGSLDRLDTVLKVFGMLNATRTSSSMPRCWMVASICSWRCTGIMGAPPARGRDGQLARQHFGRDRGRRPGEIGTSLTVSLRLGGRNGTGFNPMRPSGQTFAMSSTCRFQAHSPRRA